MEQLLARRRTHIQIWGDSGYLKYYIEEISSISLAAFAEPLLFDSIRYV